MSKVVVMDHPLIQHKIGIIRREETGSKDFRTLEMCIRDRSSTSGHRDHDNGRNRIRGGSVGRCDQSGNE